MTTLILDKPDYQLSLQQGILHINHDGHPDRSMPIAALQRLVLGRGITISTDLQLAMSEQGKELILLGRCSSAALFASHAAPNQLRLQQYQAINQERCRYQLATLLMQTRWRGQNTVLRKLQQPQYPVPQSSPNLMLTEAQISRHYWQCWASLLTAWGFNGRHRQPPSDPINALLSLTSTLEDHALMSPLLAEGFDLTLGFHHLTGYQRASLILDIKEITRAELEWWVICLCQRGEILPQHFQLTEQGCRLTRAGQQCFYPAWYRWQKRRKTGLRRLARLCHRILTHQLAQEANDD